jgi:AIPR protein
LQEKVGRKERGQLYVKNPQIINGGQTAYTLSYIYEDAINAGEDVEKVFDGKEVMLKVITFADTTSREQVNNLIEEVSKSTNRQTPVEEADRRSNDSMQIQLQKTF